MSNELNGPLDGLRVVELTDDIGRFAGKLLAESGASVVRVGRGRPARRCATPTSRRGAGCSTGGTTAASAASTSISHARPAGRPTAGWPSRPTWSSRPQRPGRLAELGLDRDDSPPQPGAGPGRADTVRPHRAAAGWQTSDLVAGALSGVLSISGTPEQAVGAWGRQNLNFGSLMACICGLAGCTRHGRPARAASSTSRCTR